MRDQIVVFSCALIIGAQLCVLGSQTVWADDIVDDPFKTDHGNPFGGTPTPKDPSKADGKKNSSSKPLPKWSAEATKKKTPPRRAPIVIAGEPIDAKANEANIRKVLGEETTFIDFQETPLREAVAFLRDFHKIEIQLDCKALDEAGIETDAPITIDLKGRTLRSALRHMLKSLDLKFIIRDEAVVITTPEVAEDHLTAQIYDVRDLIAPKPVDYDSLIQVIRSCIAPATWTEGTGPPSDVIPFRGTLIISQTDEVHRQISGLLTQLIQLRRDGGKSIAPVDARVLTKWQQANDQKIRDVLASKATFDFQETPVEEVASFLSETYKIPFLVDEDTIAEAGIETGVRITTKLKDISLASALKHALGRHDLAATVEDEAVLITSAERAHEFLTVRLYPVGDLLAEGSEEETLASAIQSTVVADTWGSTRGPGSIAGFSPARCLVVAQTNDGHTAVTNLLTKLRGRKKPAAEKKAETPGSE